MKKFNPGEKATILYIAGKINHLHIICSQPFFNADTGASSVLAVNISSIRTDAAFDSTCILHVGDHPFIKHDSYVRYKDAVMMKVANIQAHIETGEIKVLENVSNEVFQRVLAGFTKSIYTKTKIKKIVMDLSQDKEKPQRENLGAKASD